MLVLKSDVFYIEPTECVCGGGGDVKYLFDTKNVV